MIPPSYSVCLGPADTSIQYGESFIAADAPLRDDPELLHGLRHWLTLDANSADHDRFRDRPRDRLEGWSCFPAGPYYFVVRLGAAGKPGRRDPYFAHGRAWPLSAFSAGFDPGLYLGQGDAFLHQAPTPGAAPVAELPPPTIEPLAPILAGKPLVTSLITHLFHGMMTGLPVILAVPLSEFSDAAPLARIVAFARGALPGRLRRRCRVRVFSRDLESFLGSRAQDAATGLVDLLVIPEELSGPALLTVRRRALLLDSSGERHDGPAPAANLGDYARAVVETAQRFPGHLTGFGERFDQRWADTGDLPGPELTDWVTLTYHLAVALAGTEAQCGSLFANCLLDQARANAQVPWPALIGPEEWASFPQDQLIRFILRADDALSPGERHLQTVLVDAFQRLGQTIDEDRAAWWNPAEVSKRRRLLELCALTPAVITDTRYLTDLMEQEPETTTAVLIEAGTWLAWRRSADQHLATETRHRLAMTWLTSPAFNSLRDEMARERPPQWHAGERRDGNKALVDTSRETWSQVLIDLDHLTVDEINRLTQPATHWPWIYPFQAEQARALAALCWDQDGREALIADLYRPST